MSGPPPSFDLIVATVGRTGELALLLDSVEAQENVSVRVLVVDQNDDDRIAPALAGRALEIVRLRSPRGLSRARNVALRALASELVAFPDDDCAYPPGLLESVAHRLASDRALDGLAGRTEDARGSSSASWKRDRALLTEDNLWNRANAATVFLRHDIVHRVGEFDERLGLGSEEPWSSGEETDYLVRAVRAGARIEYDPTLVVRHDVRADDARVGRRDGASLGYLLRKHGYPPRTVVRMFARPIGGAALALARLDTARARYYAASLRGRIEGYRGESSAKSSA